MHRIKNIVGGLIFIFLLAGCGAGGNNQGLEYAPNMYHSIAYEPLKQVTDENAGQWLTSIDYPDGHGEFYNSNKLNPFSMNMRVPPANTVKRNAQGWLPYRIPKDSIAFAQNLINPLDSSAAVVASGKLLYEMYCDHCHGAKGLGDGKVADKYAGVANLTGAALKNISEGHIFHVITQGKGLMWGHASQISPEDRWKIARYVKTLQK